MAKEELEALKFRIRQGNNTLMAAWRQIGDLDGEERERQLDRWDKAAKKLNGLCRQLIDGGRRDCLYDIPTMELDCLDRDESCLVCPVDWGKKD